jgi:hypothetical protein
MKFRMAFSFRRRSILSELIPIRRDSIQENNDLPLNSIWQPFKPTCSIPQIEDFSGNALPSSQAASISQAIERQDVFAGWAIF